MTPHKRELYVVARTEYGDFMYLRELNVRRLPEDRLRLDWTLRFEEAQLFITQKTAEMFSDQVYRSLPVPGRIGVARVQVLVQLEAKPSELLGVLGEAAISSSDKALFHVLRDMALEDSR